VDAAVELGADAVGFVLVPGSPRRIDLATAAALRRRLPPFMVAVALFRNADPALVQEAIRRMQPELLQFHGDETADYAESFRHRYLAVVPMGTADVDVAATLARHPRATGVLFDAHVRGGMGGQGTAFDWSRIPRGLGRPVILAGGLSVENVAEAVRRVRPYAVDVSSGIEAVPGIKDYAKMKAFIEEVQRGERG
jgi:phosphoribosylanthranilate isomerase